ncbi:MAG: terpene cyclase/mutase family protein [Rhodopirellula sp.]|nr:terpene cyclase/mutase family protein [Rhodopirellula sp.]
MATADHDSSLDITPYRAGSPGGSPSSSASQEIRLDGDVLACACPDCGAPMSIRLWLMVADCWRCGASIELTEEQEKEALRLLREQEEERQSAASQTQKAVAAIEPTMLRKPKPPPAPRTPPLPPQTNAPRVAPRKSLPATAPPAARQQPPPLRRRPAATRLHPHLRARLKAAHEKGLWGLFFSELLRNLPAWLVSLVFHLVVILLLGLWMIGPEEEDLSITLATRISDRDIEGGIIVPDPEEEAFEFEDPGELKLLVSAALPSTGISPELETPALHVPDPIGELPQLSQLATALPSSATGTMFSGRDPALRSQIVEKEGGTSYTEAAVAGGLKWLARYQNNDGSWSLDTFHLAPRATGKESGQGGHSDTAGTALALLPFLGAGETHEHGEYSEVVLKGLQWLIDRQEPDGDLSGDGIGRMYAHGQAAIALCEAYALSRDQRLHEPAQRSLDYIVKAQHPAGGWRYEPGMAGDMSVVGWQLMALRSGTMAYLIVPRKTFEAADRFLDSVAADRRGSRYGYLPGQTPTPRMTAEALLCRQYLGWPRDHLGLQAGVNFLADRSPPSQAKADMYYWYYATQVMHHLGGSTWQRWNQRMRTVLVDSQETKEPHAGSWAPRGEFSQEGGRIYMTALALCTLEVYYRHLPLYREDVLQGIWQE